MRSVLPRLGLTLAALVLGGCYTPPAGSVDAGSAMEPGSIQLEFVRTPCDTLPFFLSGKAPRVPNRPRVDPGQAVLAFTIDETGRTHNIRVISESGNRSTNSAGAISGWRMGQYGKPVPVPDIHANAERGESFGAVSEVAIRSWRFEPARRDGNPIAVDVQQMIPFGSSADLAYSSDPIWKIYYQALKAMGEKNYLVAIAHLNSLLPLDDDVMHVRVLTARGTAYGRLRAYDKEIADYQASLRLDPNGDGIYNTLAWLYATAPDARARDGKQAVELAQRACTLTDWKQGSELDTLAAAYAEAGDFAQAMAYQQKAIAAAGVTKTTLKGMQQRLELYRQHQPYRDPA